jgi:hypothetical protein
VQEYTDAPFPPATTLTMSDTDTPTEGPISLQELEKRLTNGEISKNTRVRMPDGQEWMLLPSSTRSEPAGTDQIRRLNRLRRETAYGSVRWLLKFVAWLSCVAAVALVFFERFSSWLLIGSDELQLEFALRIKCALLLGLAGFLLDFGGEMLVDLFDLLLAKHSCRIGSSEKSQSNTPNESNVV